MSAGCGRDSGCDGVAVDEKLDTRRVAGFVRARIKEEVAESDKPAAGWHIGVLCDGGGCALIEPCDAVGR